jgi:NAD(P)-dependent dehydrogenase (short-subunit alcohol dehydrogenase family)
MSATDTAAAGTRDLVNKVVVITGATSGIGQVAAETLAARGARIVQIARDRTRGEAALDRLNRRAPGLGHTVWYGDLSRIREMKRLASEIAAAEPRIDVLINNAGAIFNRRQVTEDGLELTFALNHMAYFVLTAGLRERMAASAPSRIVNTASDAHAPATLDFDDLQSEKAYAANHLRDWLRYGGPAFRVYGRSKLCNILFTRELAKRLAGTGVTANCLHPGFVATRFGDQAGGFLGFGVRFAKKFALSLEEGAQTLIYLAASPDVAAVSGNYFHKCRPIAPSRAAQDDTAAGRLWNESLRLAQLNEA